MRGLLPRQVPRSFAARTVHHHRRFSTHHAGPAAFAARTPVHTHTSSSCGLRLTPPFAGICSARACLHAAPARTIAALCLPRGKTPEQKEKNRNEQRLLVHACCCLLRTSQRSACRRSGGRAGQRACLRCLPSLLCQQAWHSPAIRLFSMGYLVQFSMFLYSLSGVVVAREYADILFYSFHYSSILLLLFMFLSIGQDMIFYSSIPLH